MSKLNSPLFLFLAAKEYFENGTLYASKYFKRKNGELVQPFDSLIHTKLCVPASNISFSLELAIKGLLMTEQLVTKGHDLALLYQQLTDELKFEILQHYKAHDEYKNYIGIRLLEGDGRGHGQIHEIGSIIKNEENVIKLLQQHKSSFVNFRYMHDFRDGEIWQFDFNQMSNYTYSTLCVLGSRVDQKVSIIKSTLKNLNN